MPKLKTYKDYSRQMVHDIFAPNTSFTPQSGTWGLQGIIAIPNRPDDFVFFVTFGSRQGEHVFEEGITKDGVLSWQSQPKQSLDNKQIKQFIAHDELKNSIYLFLRTQKTIDYTFLGRLKYLTHDVEREKPVWFQWQILDWAISKEDVERISLVLSTATQKSIGDTNLSRNTLEETTPPVSRLRQGKVTEKFRAYKIADYSASEAKKSDLGLAGEIQVLKYEKDYLENQGFPELAMKVRHVSQIEGDGAGYDILSYTLDGQEKYIEVKTTAGTSENSFYITKNELAFSKLHPNNYYLYRVYSFNVITNSGKFYVKVGSVESAFSLVATEYRATPT